MDGRKTSGLCSAIGRRKLAIDGKTHLDPIDFEAMKFIPGPVSSKTSQNV